MSLNAEERASIIAKVVQRKFGPLLNWERPALIHDFGPNDLDKVEDFERKLSETRTEAQSLLKALTDQDILSITAALSDPYQITEESWFTPLAGRVDQLTQFPPPPIAFGFGHPKFATDFDHWGRMRKLSLHEVTLLSVGADPSSVTERQIEGFQRTKAEGRKLWSAHEFLLKQWEVFRRFYSATDIGFPAERIENVKEWIDCVDLPAHPEFYAGLEKLLTSKTKTPQPSNPSTALTKQERVTLLKLVAAMACEQYGYNPKASRSEVPKNIKDDLERIGQSMDDKTIRKWLKEASEHVDPSYWSPNV